AITTFKKNHKGSIPTFMNSQKENTVIDFTNIQLISNDTSKRFKYEDESLFNNDSLVNIFYNSDFQYGLKFWDSNTTDTIIHNIVKTEWGNTIEVSRKNGTGYWPLIYTGRPIFFHKGQKYTFKFHFRTIKGKGRPFQIGWAYKENDKVLYYIKVKTYPLPNNWKLGVASYTFKENHYKNTPLFMNSQQANTTLQFANIELLTDSAFIDSAFVDQNIEKVKAIREKELLRLQKYDSTDRLFAPRTLRWKYAWTLFQKYNFIQKTFGNGFAYLNIFGEKFKEQNNELRPDYPHNPILSALLYSGLTGALYYLYFLGLVFWYYWKYRKHHLIFFILFLVSFFFVFLSGNSHFSVPIFAILSMVPFITRYLIKIKETQNSQK
ncbi:MAG: O-antigen ligase family protein, partial [Bacteroidales bacterium]|nr:O-antigen ligase family protein [Bacteroidales bacterium]